MLFKKDRKSLEEYLLENKVIDNDKLKKIMEDCRKNGDTLRHFIIKQKAIPEEHLLNYFEKELKIARANFSRYKIDAALLKLVPENFAKKNSLIPLFKSENGLIVAMADPLNIIVLDELRLKAGCEIEPVVESESKICEAIEKFYASTSGSIEEIIKTMDPNIISVQAEDEEELDAAQLQNMAEEAPIIKLVNAIIVQAIKERASDIHIEPSEDALHVRNRIDGILHDSAKIPRHLQAAIVSRIKIMSDLNIAQKRQPQDGRFQIKIGNDPIDFRVSSFPTIYGENVVMRVLDPKSVLIGLEQLGFSPANLKIFKKLINRPHGVVLVTGPTGSGKSTTLYAALNSINTPEKNIITIEDPVEYKLAGIRQSQVNVKAGLTFATGLRSILRQDPDVIMVGEIRDLETAEIAIQAALTGHLVFATLHTNDAPGAVTRLIDMGVEPFLIASSVIAVLAQRQVRTICPKCKKEVPINKTDLEKLGLGTKDEKMHVYEGKGCENCKKTGYRGRIGIVEIMMMDDKIKDLVIKKSGTPAIVKEAKEAGMKNLREDGMEKAIAGITTLEEVIRVTSEE